MRGNVKIISIISQKGGAGKTTLAVNLAVLLEQNSKAVLLLDLDPQASSSYWSDSRSQTVPVVVAAQQNRLHQLLETGRENGADFVIIDTAPHSESAAFESSQVADIVIIPCRAGILDIRAIQSSLNICKLTEKTPYVLLNALPFRGSIAEEAVQAIRQIGGVVMNSSVGQRIAFNHAMTAGLGVVEYEPKGKASIEMHEIFHEIMTYFGDKK